MQRIPLFPLPVVLYPGAWMPLHIFEERYRLMIADCLEGSGEFGLIYHQPDEQGPFMMETGRVGTIACIEKHQLLPDGRSMILLRGAQRFAISAERPMERLYYEADVVPFDDVTVPRADAIIEVRARTLELFMTVVTEMSDLADEVPSYDVNLDLSFQLAPSIQIDSRWQQSLLETRQEVERLERLEAVFQAALDRNLPDE